MWYDKLVNIRGFLVWLGFQNLPVPTVGKPAMVLNNAHQETMQGCFYHACLHFQSGLSMSKWEKSQ